MSGKEHPENIAGFLKLSLGRYRASFQGFTQIEADKIFKNCLKYIENIMTNPETPNQDTGEPIELSSGEHRIYLEGFTKIEVQAFINNALGIRQDG
jgi:hypothetical protein